MSEVKTTEQRLSELEVVVRTLTLFNQNAMAIVSRRITQGNPAIADALVQDLAGLRAHRYNDVDQGLYDSHIDSLIAMVI